MDTPAIAVVTDPGLHWHSLGGLVATQAFQMASGFIMVGVLHWFVVNLYANFCAPPSLFGAIQSFVTMGSPVCQFLNKVQYELTNHFSFAITIMASSFLTLVKSQVNKPTLGQ